MSMQLPLFNQRWRLRRDSYRPAGEPINPRLYEVAELAGDRESKAFILTHHYSASLSKRAIQVWASHRRGTGRRGDLQSPL